MPAWFAWSLLALVSWGVWAIISRLIGGDLSPAQQQALSTVGMLPVIALLLLRGTKQPSANPRLGTAVALAAGVLSCMGNVTYYDALNRGAKAATVVPLTAMYPLVTILLAVLLLRERLNRLQLCGIICSLGAIYLLNVSSATGFFSPWMLLALLPIALWGITGFLQKLSTNDIPGEHSTLWFLLAFMPAALIILLTQPYPGALPARIWLWLTALGFFFALGNLAILLAFARGGKASIITPLTALYPVVSIPLAVLALQEKISVREGTGILLALAAVAALSWQGGPTQPQASAGVPIRSGSPGAEDVKHEVHH